MDQLASGAGGFFDQRSLACARVRLGLAEAYL
jgi:hypothetical protein